MTKEVSDHRIIVETYGAQVKRIHQISSYNDKWKTQDKSPKYQSLTNFFMTAFLPHGFPDSVSDDYLQYQLWDSIQAFASSISGGICTHSVLKGYGVGDESATVVAATITWLLKDGVHMVGRIVFAWLQGTKFDSDCKKWRLFADVLNDVAMFLDLVSSYFTNYFMTITCTSGLMKALVGVSGSCTRAALTQHQARNNNLADVSAKDGSQETLLNLLALFCSLVLLPVVTKSQMLTWILFFAMVVLHLFANYMAVKSVVMETLNEARFRIFADRYFWREFLTVKDVNERENVFFNLWPERFQVHLGAPIMDVLKDKSFKECLKYVQVYKDCAYILGVSMVKKKGHVRTRTIDVNIAFAPEATPLTYLEAYYQACYIQHCLDNFDLFELEIQWEMLHNDKCFEYRLGEKSRAHTEKTFDHFITILKAQNFNSEIVNFNIDSWRSYW